MYNQYDGVQHDYTRKSGLAYQAVLLPSQAPAEWQDREQLWNAVELAEKNKDSRLAREFNGALPIELDKEQWIELLNDFVQKNFVDEGMCADVVIHTAKKNNPHFHLMVTVRPLDDKGKWQAKTQKEYLCIKDGEEKGFTADEFKKVLHELQNDRKHYDYERYQQAEQFVDRALQDEPIQPEKRPEVIEQEQREAAEQEKNYRSKTNDMEL